MKIACIRHGQTNYNLEKLCNDDYLKDVRLTSLGVSQAQDLRVFISDFNPRFILTSPLPRAVQTASIASNMLADRIRIEMRLRDRKTGHDSQPAEIFWKCIEYDLFGARVNGGESFYEVQERVISLLKDLETTGDDVCLVTHSEIMKIIIGHYHQLDNPAIWALQIPACTPEIFIIK